MDFSDNLHRLMDERGVSTITLGRALNVSDESVSNWRKGKSLPKLDVALRIAKYFDVSLTDLAGLTVTNPRGEQATFIRIPVLGDVSAGALEIASLLTGRYLTINEVLLDGYPREECFALLVNGQSMEPEFPDRSFIIIHQQFQCSDGDYVIVLDETTGENTFKKYVKDADCIRLKPLNPDYKELVYRKQDINRLRIQGVVINDYYRPATM